MIESTNVKVDEYLCQISQELEVCGSNIPPYIEEDEEEKEDKKQES